MLIWGTLKGPSEVRVEGRDLGLAGRVSARSIYSHTRHFVHSSLCPKLRHRPAPHRLEEQPVENYSFPSQWRALSYNVDQFAFPSSCADISCIRRTLWLRWGKGLFQMGAIVSKRNFVIQLISTEGFSFDSDGYLRPLHSWEQENKLHYPTWEYSLYVEKRKQYVWTADWLTGPQVSFLLSGLAAAQQPADDSPTVALTTYRSANCSDEYSTTPSSVLVSPPVGGCVDLPPQTNALSFRVMNGAIPNACELYIYEAPNCAQSAMKV